MACDLAGKIKLIQEAKTFDSGFTKRDMVVIVEDGKYPREINIEFVQDKVALLNSVQAGQDVTVTFDLRDREHNGRSFNNFQGWKIVIVRDEPAFTSADPAPTLPTLRPLILKMATFLASSVCLCLSLSRYDRACFSDVG